MTSDQSHGFSTTHHDWHSGQYVDQWIARDVTRDAERRPMLERMVALAGLPPGTQPRVLDIGGGYGLVTEEVFRAFPQASVTLQDYGLFLDCDHLDTAGGVDAHLDAMKAAGFADAVCAWRDDHNAIVKATKG